MKSLETTDGTPKTSPTDLSENLTKDSLKTLTPNQKFLRSVYRRWVNAARANCGTPFIHQAYKNPSLPGPGSNTPTDISSKRM